MNKSPAFQFYAAEFLADENVVMMSNQEVGCYIKLMAYCWREGSIPSDISKIGKLCGEDGSAMAQLWLSIGCCFSSASTSDRLIHKRLETEREKQEKYRFERSESGKKGAKAKWNNELPIDGSAITEPIAQPMANDGSSSSTSSSTSFKKQKKPSVPMPEGMNKEIWQDFLSTRAKGITQTGLNGIAKQAALAGISLEAALQECCTRNWQSFRADWIKPQQGTQSGKFNAGKYIRDQLKMESQLAEKVVGSGVAQEIGDGVSDKIPF
jgi:uncharacterized protein YdaU (DUF1376 family)